jgi:RNA recognition motif-containing protein
METKLYVGNLSYETREDSLRTLFAQAGTVVSVEVIMDRATGRSKGFAFVQMSNQAEAENAIRMFNGYSLDSRDLRVNVARPKEEMGRGGFGGPRRSGGGGFDREGRGNRGDDRRGGGGQRRY